MKKKLKSKFPSLYEYYLHIKRQRKIKEIEKIKAMPIGTYQKILEKLYEDKIGHKLNWDNLITYTEKMQWEKLFNNNPYKSVLADKYEVRKWISQKIGKEYLIPILGCWNCFNEINFAQLPNKFVLKTNHGSGTILIVKDKNKLDKKKARVMFSDWLATDYGYNTGFELHYSKIAPKIIAEEYIETELGDLQDYKFLCFDGKPYFCWVDMGRYSKHTRNVYNMEWELQPWNQATYGVYEKPIPKPKNLDKMIELATILSEGFSHVRVDFYNIDGKIYFGEMTFTNGSGLDKIIPEEYDKMLGELWNIDTHIKNK
ncbi:ATP-grasp fold amidoligase family protein [Clostridium sp. D53t1_180928_C8]|uniref:ATP-grasp fold amidoligase family protein n=1 Tax=Clostridium sp. D53t1_180928_C8 TaxID=2787101 RepID=UPI0018A906FB|nr:ATP-grasp fold amidoligase family protein [Clostridium sp. D53t1_180928_C8]